MKPSTSLGTRSNVGIAKPSPAVRQTGNMRCLLVMGGVYRSSVLSGGTQVKYRCRCRDNKTFGYCWPTHLKVLTELFLVKVSPAFLPSKKACGIHKRRHF